MSSTVKTKLRLYLATDFTWIIEKSPLLWPCLKYDDGSNMRVSEL